MLNLIASLTPMYLFNLVMGCSLMMLNDDLASSPFVQYIIAACFGTILGEEGGKLELLFYYTTNIVHIFLPSLYPPFTFSHPLLAFIWLAMAVYRMVENMTKSTMPPFHPLLAPVSFLSTSYLFTGPMVRDRMMDFMVRTNPTNILSYVSSIFSDMPFYVMLRNRIMISMSMLRTS